MNATTVPCSILLVGTLPPPFHGQSLATQALFNADFSPLRIERIGIHSSKELAEVGRASLSKAMNLLGLISRVWRTSLKLQPQVLYYTAGSGAWVPFVRDLLFLSLCRPLFQRTIIHYHSGDLWDFIESTALRRKLGWWIYGRSAWTIKLGIGCPVPDFPGNRVFEVPNGIEAPAVLPERKSGEAFRILFLGNLFLEKGVLDLIEAVKLLARRDARMIELHMVGAWPDEDSRHSILSALKNLPEHVVVVDPAPAFGDEKWTRLRNSDVLVFPTRYRRENLPLVIIEAMAASRPVVATRWRGIPTLVRHGETGFLQDVGDIQGISKSLGQIMDNPALRIAMGEKARRDYEQRFSMMIFVENLRSIFKQAVRDVSDCSTLPGLHEQ
jgi:glycosyltransferase involved in cell wall biosynthesis